MVTKKDCKEIIYVWNGFTNGLPVFENWFLHKNFLKTKGTQIYIDFENISCCRKQILAIREGYC